MSVWVLRDCYFKRQYLYGFEGELTHLKLPIPVGYAWSFAFRWEYSVSSKLWFLYFLQDKHNWVPGGSHAMESMLPILNQFGIKGLP